MSTSAAYGDEPLTQLAPLVCAAAEQHALLLKHEGTLDVAVDCMGALFGEGRPGMLLQEDVVRAQRALISIMLELAEASECAP